MNNLLWAFAAAVAIALAPAAEAAFSKMAAPPPAHRASLVQLAECDDDCQEHVQDYMEERQQQIEAAQEARRDALEDDDRPHRLDRDLEYGRFERGADPRQIEQQKAIAARQVAPQKQTPASKPEPDAETVAKAKAVKDSPPPQLATVEPGSAKAPAADAPTTAEAKAVEPAPAPKPAGAKACSQYFAAINRALSVPCE